MAIITVSDSAVAGTREDLSGPALEAKTDELGWNATVKLVLPDEREQIAAALRELADLGEIDVVLTTGGTGLAPRDVTPEATRAVADREAPGFGELMRTEGLKEHEIRGAFARGRGYAGDGVDRESAWVAEGRGGVADGRGALDSPRG